jgi:hypothetical protein
MPEQELKSITEVNAQEGGSRKRRVVKKSKPVRRSKSPVRKGRGGGVVDLRPQRFAGGDLLDNIKETVTKALNQSQEGGVRRRRRSPSKKSSRGGEPEQGQQVEQQKGQEGGVRRRRRSPSKKSSRRGGDPDQVQQTQEGASSGGGCGQSQQGGIRRKTRKPSAYNLFMKKRMAEMKKSNSKLSAPERMKRIAGEWKKKSH